MSGYELDFHRLAFRELQEALRRYRTQSVKVANRFIVAVDQAIQKITANPLQWTAFHPGFRWLTVRKFPYVLYYHIISENRIRIVAVAHAKRRPGYWIKRASRP